MNKNPQIIIDGYNMILRTQNKPFGDENDIWQARQNLIDRLAAYKSQKNVNITIVFDGSQDFTENHAHRRSGINIRFDKIADSLIKEIVDRAVQPRNVTVVTSDRDLAFAVRSQGAQTLAVEAFERKLKNRTNPSREYDAKYNARLSPKEVNDWLKLFKGDSDTN
jgi:predicted RNA-binding protein with PIN domain